MRQGRHLLLLVALVGGITGLADYVDAWEGQYRGLSTPTWFGLALGSAVVHQWWVWLCWRVELHTGWLTRTFGPAGFRAISEFPKGRKYLISLSFRGKASVRPAQVGGFDVNIVIHGSTAVRGRGDLVAYRWALWKLTAPWTHRTRPPHLGKRCAFSTSSTGPFPSNDSRKTPKGPKIALGNPDRPGFRLYATGFALLVVTSFFLLIAVAAANPQTLQVSETLLDLIATALLVPMSICSIRSPATSRFVGQSASTISIRPTARSPWNGAASSALPATACTRSACCWCGCLDCTPHRRRRSSRRSSITPISGCTTSAPSCRTCGGCTGRHRSERRVLQPVRRESTRGSRPDTFALLAATLHCHATPIGGWQWQQCTGVAALAAGWQCGGSGSVRQEGQGVGMCAVSSSNQFSP